MNAVNDWGNLPPPRASLGSFDVRRQLPASQDSVLPQEDNDWGNLTQVTVFTNQHVAGFLPRNPKPCQVDPEVHHHVLSSQEAP
jgi:hypothetical protein